MIKPPFILLRMKNVSDKVVEKIKTHILYSVTFFFLKIVPFMRQCGEIWTRQATDDNVIRRMRV